MSSLTPILILVITGVFVFSFITTAYAVIPPDEFTFQGILKDSSNNLVTATKDITLEIYSVLTGGKTLWTETHDNISVSTGIFTVSAGSQNTFAASGLNFTNTLYLQVLVADSSGANSETLTPRIQISGAPFALAAARASVDFNVNQKDIVNATLVNATNLQIGDSGSARTVGLLNYTNSLVDYIVIGNVKSFDNMTINAGTTITNTTADTGVVLNVLQLNATSTTTDSGLGFGSGLSFGVQDDRGIVVEAGTIEAYWEFNDPLNATIAVNVTVTDRPQTVLFIKNGTLTVNGTIQARAGEPGSFGTNHNGYTFSNNGDITGDDDSGMFSSADGFIDFFNNAVKRTTMQDDGNVVIRGTSGTCTLNGAVNTCTSDIKLKKNIEDLENSLDGVMKLRPITYNLKDPTKDQGTFIGLVAQEVEPIFPELVDEINVGSAKEKEIFLGIGYERLTPILIGAIQEQQAQIDQLKVENDLLRAEFESLKKEQNFIKQLLCVITFSECK